MKWYHSLLVRITLIFALALAGMSAIFFVVARYETLRDVQTVVDYSHVALRAAFDRQTQNLDFGKLEEMGFSLVTDEMLKDKILDRPRPPKPFPMKRMEERFRYGVDCVPYGMHIYTILLNRDMPPIVLEAPFKKEILPRIVFPLLALAFVVILYIGIIRSLLPLKNLREQIKRFANGHYDITCKSKKRDEIAALANEFDAAVTKIKSLRDSRQLFLRNIMHELKTPITKGKLAAEMLEDTTYASILQNVFKRQEALLEEFSRIEKLSADELKLDIKAYHVEDIVDFALDLLADKKEHITCELLPIDLNVDFELFGVALKNLLDNGVTYSKNAHVTLCNDTERITISNEAPALECTLEDYAKPYFLEGKKQKSSRGLGFGLFITWHVIRLHGMKLEYKHDKGKNVFTIWLKNEASSPL
ncbi:MAG: HAMP domain-containing histidine kinase [Epsilonproteobacteria bacterium]|nr:HAMP domain-containing histidine kinase [Campylobacterota bacterium]